MWGEKGETYGGRRSKVDKEGESEMYSESGREMREGRKKKTRLGLREEEIEMEAVEGRREIMMKSGNWRWKRKYYIDH